MKIAFSTVACPDWTLERVLSFTDEVEYDGVELRTFGWGESDFTCEPALTAAAKLRRMGLESGTDLMCLATSLKFDDAVRPPVVGRVLPGHDRWLQESRRFVALADELECPLLRVFGYESPAGERRSRTIARIVERLGEVLSAAGKRRVTVVLENGGSFRRARDLAEIIAACDSPWIGAAYDVAVGASAGDRPEDAIDLLGERLQTVKLRDVRDERLVEIGHGEIPLEGCVRRLASDGFRGWLVVEWPRVWRPDLEPAEGVLQRSLGTIEGWIRQSRRGRRAAGTPAEAQGVGV